MPHRRRGIFRSGLAGCACAEVILALGEQREYPTRCDRTQRRATDHDEFDCELGTEPAQRRGQFD
jgi:hypothetical protein